MRIAVLDDDPAQADFVCEALAAADYVCCSFSAGNLLVEQLKHETFDLLVLDWNVPGMSGEEVLRWVRESLSERVPVVFLTSCDSEADVSSIFALGADDYLVKPVRADVLRARVTSLLRCAYRFNPCEGTETFGDFVFDLRTSQTATHGIPIELTREEFELALLLFRHLGRPLSRAHIQEAVWHNVAGVSSRTIDTHMSVIRAKLDLRPQHGYRLASIAGYGYRLDRMKDDQP
jgi:DNA-binding response OmpR family regulator